MRLDVHRDHRFFLAVSAGVYVLLLVLVGVLPAADLDRRFPPGGGPPPDPLVERGKDLYRSYGCVACHTQQVRGDERLGRTTEDGRVEVPVLAADRRFGLDRPSRAEEYRDDDPPLLGTQRTGPDLSAVGTRLPSATWHYWHLYDPRAVAPDSNMPGHPWLFHTEEGRRPEDEAVEPLAALDVPKGRLFATPDARALVEYLLSRTRPEATR